MAMYCFVCPWARQPLQPRSKKMRRNREEAARRNIQDGNRDSVVAPFATQRDLEKSYRVLSKMRSEGLSLRQAATGESIKSRRVTELVRQALRKRKNRSYAATESDSLLRVVQVPTSHGSREIALRNSRHASTLGRYWDAVHKYLRTGDAAGIEKFRGKRIKDANGNQVQLITNFAKLNRLGSAGVLSFESLYARAA
jgi:hypothetical protein